MPGNLMHVNATVTCPHGGQATAQPGQSRVLVSGQPVTTLASLYTVAGCVFTVAGRPDPGERLARPAVQPARHLPERRADSAGPGVRGHRPDQGGGPVTAPGA